MKVIYEFDTCAEDYDIQEHEAIKQASNMAYALNAICNEFRSWTKYSAFPRKQIVKEEDIIYEGQREYIEDLNAFIEKYPNVIADVWEMRDRIMDIINNEANVDMEKMGY